MGGAFRDVRAIEQACCLVDMRFFYVAATELAVTSLYLRASVFVGLFGHVH